MYFCFSSNLHPAQAGQKVGKNVVMSSGNFDMSDANPMCVPAVWTKNVFITRDQTCIE